MRKVLQRLLIFFLGVPLIYVLVVCFAQYHHLAMHIFLILLNIVATLELYKMFKTKVAVQSKLPVVFASSLLPVSAMIVSIFSLPNEIISYTFVICLLFLAAIEIFSAKADNFEFSILKISSSAFILLYTGYLLTFLGRMSSWKFASEKIIVFLFMVFACDSLAWFFGITMGKTTRGFIAASPNKSLVGFAGGFLGSALVGVLAAYVYPSSFGCSIIRNVILGIVIAFTSILGDLVESVLKRSAQVKDSGSVVLGRGGVLDSIDSIVFSAPIYYIFINIFYIM